MTRDFYEQTVLPNGLRVLTATMPHTHSVALALYVGTGSRYEKDEQAGISHFLEHMLFKGTETRRSAKEIAEAIDGVGGAMNGGTDREYTIYYIKVAKPHRELALDILLEMVRRPLMEPDEVEKERQVIVEELAMVEDNPSQIADLLLDSIMWPGNPLGRDVAGTPDSVAAIDRDVMRQYLHDQYRPNNTVISVAGNVEHQEIVGQVEVYLDGWESGDIAQMAPAPRANGTRCAVHFKKTEQAHVSIATPGLNLNHPDRHALAFLSVILGEGMSSRLFVELREKRGLVYDVHTYVSQFLDAGAFHVYTGVDPKNAVQALNVIVDELSLLCGKGPTEEELHKARELSKGRLMLRMEDTRAVSGWIGAQQLLLGKIRSVDDSVAEMDAVTIDDVRRVAGDLIDPAKAHLAVVGPYRSDKRFASILPA